MEVKACMGCFVEWDREREESDEKAGIFIAGR